MSSVIGLGKLSNDLYRKSICDAAERLSNRPELQGNGKESTAGAIVDALQNNPLAVADATFGPQFDDALLPAVVGALRGQLPERAAKRRRVDESAARIAAPILTTPENAQRDAHDLRPAAAAAAHPASLPPSTGNALAMPASSAAAALAHRNRPAIVAPVAAASSSAPSNAAPAPIVVPNVAPPVQQPLANAAAQPGSFARSALSLVARPNQAMSAVLYRPAQFPQVPNVEIARVLGDRVLPHCDKLQEFIVAMKWKADKLLRLSSLEQNQSMSEFQSLQNYLHPAPPARAHQRQSAAAAANADAGNAIVAPIDGNSVASSSTQESAFHKYSRLLRESQLLYNLYRSLYHRALFVDAVPRFGIRAYGRRGVQRVRI